MTELTPEERDAYAPPGSLTDHHPTPLEKLADDLVVTIQIQQDPPKVLVKGPGVRLYMPPEHIHRVLLDGYDPEAILARQVRAGVAVARAHPELVCRP